MQFSQLGFFRWLIGKPAFYLSSFVLILFLPVLLAVSDAFAQQVPAHDAISADSKTSGQAAASAAPAAPSQATTAGGVKAGDKQPVPGLDPKTGRPLYEEIQEDWSSLGIGTSKLEPLPPMIGGIDEQPKFTRVMARVQWRPGDPIDLWITLPKGVSQPPVVLYLYNEDQDPYRFRDDHWCQRVTAGGVAAVGFVSALSGPRFHDRPMKQWFVSELQESLGSTVHDVKFILDYLAKSGQVDMNRVGIFGEGSGGAIAILAAAADSRIKAVDALDPWGDWPDFLAKSAVMQDSAVDENYTKPEFLKKVAPLDPVKWLPELKTPIRIQQVRDNEATPMACKEAIKAAAPKQAEVVRFAGVTDLGKREGQGRLFEWIKDKLRESGKPGTGAEGKVSVADKGAGKPVTEQAK